MHRRSTGSCNLEQPFVGCEPNPLSVGGKEWIGAAFSAVQCNGIRLMLLLDVQWKRSKADGVRIGKHDCRSVVGDCKEKRPHGWKPSCFAVRTQGNAVSLSSWWGCTRLHPRHDGGHQQECRQ